MFTSKSKKNFNQTVISGFLIAIPILVVNFILGNVLIKLHKGVTAILDHTALDKKYQVYVVFIIVAVITILIAYLIGSISNSKLLSRVSHNLDHVLMGAVPAYRSFKLDINRKEAMTANHTPAVMVTLDGYERPGLLIQEHPDLKKCTVFIPKTTSTFDGYVYVFPSDNVRRITASRQQLLEAVENLGYGLTLQ